MGGERVSADKDLKEMSSFEHRLSLTNIKTSKKEGPWDHLYCSWLLGSVQYKYKKYSGNGV
jgi:hypothetical protein